VSGQNHEPPRTALKRVGSLLKQTGLPFALAGSYALWARGAPESEHDVDFVVAEEDVERVVSELHAAGLIVTRPPEDWLVKITTDGVIVDILHRAAGEPVTAELLRRSDMIEVLSVAMPVLSATDLLSTKLRALSEHSCDFTALLPATRAVREQVDWARPRRETSGNDFAVAFLVLADRLEISAKSSA
jgi:hypothetical protein